MVQNPVLFITFVRPEYARRSWDAIKAAKPKTLYFYSNKGREEKDGEIKRNEEIRSYIKEIDWECDLHTWFRDKTVNVYESLYGAISWLFENEDQGIILEEDCVASLAFFDYCDKLLPRYKEDYRIWIISGDNYYEKINFGPFDYFYSQDMQIFGWASWKSRWNQVDWNKGLDIKNLILERVLDSAFRTRVKRRIYKKLINKLGDFIQETKCWDYTFLTYGIGNNSLSVVPARHLVMNIGLDGTHNHHEKVKPWNLPVSYLDPIFPVENKPAFIQPNLKYDDVALKNNLYKSFAFHHRIINKIKYLWGRFFRR